MGVKETLRRRSEVVCERIEVGRRRSNIERGHHRTEVMMPWWV